MKTQRLVMHAETLRSGMKLSARLRQGKTMGLKLPRQHDNDIQLLNIYRGLTTCLEWDMAKWGVGIMPNRGEESFDKIARI